MKSNMYISTKAGAKPFLADIEVGQQWRDTKTERIFDITSIEEGAPHGPHAVCVVLLQPKRKVVKIPVRRLLREDIFVMIRNEKRERVFRVEEVSLD